MLARHILNTITYYDVMDYPMTVFEVWKHLLIFGENNRKNGYGLEEVEEKLVELADEKRRLEYFQGLFFLRGRKEIVSKRRQKEKVSSQKIKKIFKIAKWFKFVPFICLVGLVGRVGMKNSENSSDIDVLIIISKKRIFLGRFLITGLLQIMGIRRHGKKIKNRICLNHFLSLNSQPKIQDLFSCHEYSFMVPVFKSYQNKFSFEESFGWVKKYKPNYFFTQTSSREAEDTIFSLKFKKILNLFLDHQFLEDILKKWQEKKIKRNPKTQKKDGMILVSDNELAFWPEFGNQGPMVWEKFAQSNNSKLD